MKASLSLLRLAVAGLCLGMVAKTALGADPKKDYKFVIVPKVVHPWFDKVHDGATEAAKMLTDLTGSKITIDYRAPQTADVVMQNQILESSIATKPDGITIDLLDADGNRAVLDEAIGQGIPVVIFDSEAPKDLHLTSVGNDYAAQAAAATPGVCMVR